MEPVIFMILQYPEGDFAIGTREKPYRDCATLTCESITREGLYEAMLKIEKATYKACGRETAFMLMQ